MRICSLLPSATEVIASLGLCDELVGISHECDYPPSIRHLPIMVEPVIPPHGLASADIDRQVHQLVASGQRLYRLNDELLRQVEPELILSQDLCHVCAITPDQLQNAIDSMPRQPTVLTLNPSTVLDVIDDVVRIGDAAGRSTEGHQLAAHLHDRLDAVHRSAPDRLASPSCGLYRMALSLVCRRPLGSRNGSTSRRPGCPRGARKSFASCDME